MTTQSWFDPDRVFKNLDDYLPLRELPYDVLCEQLQARFDAEQASPEGIARHRKLVERLEPQVERFGDGDQAEAIARGFAQTFYLEQLLLALKLSSPDVWGEALRVVGAEEAQAAAASGAVFVLPHMGPHFLAHVMLHAAGLPSFGAGAVSGPMAEGVKRTAALHGIDLGGATEVDFDADFKATLIQLLASGHSATLYPEYSRSPRLGSLTVDFLGHRVHAPTGIARLAQGLGKPMIGVRLRRRGAYRYDLVFGPVWRPTAPDEVHDAIRDVFAWVEAAVEEDPTSWEGWRYFGRMKDNGMRVLLQQFAQQAAK